MNFKCLLLHSLCEIGIVDDCLALHIHECFSAASILKFRIIQKRETITNAEIDDYERVYWMVTQSIVQESLFIDNSIPCTLILEIPT